MKPSEWESTLRRLAVIVFPLGIAYFPSIHGAWVWDDAGEFLSNPALRSLSGLRDAWFAPTSSDYFPLKTTFAWIEWHLFGNTAEGYHVVSILLHLLSALLLWRLLSRLGIGQAWVGALLFAVHPLCVESVAWNAELKNTLSLPLLLFSLDAYLDFEAARESGKSAQSAYIRSLALFVASLLSKTSGVMIPAVLLLYAWWRRGRMRRQDLVATAPFAAVALILGMVTIFFQDRHVIDVLGLSSAGWPARVGVAGRASLFYLVHGLAPFDLHPIYPRWAPPSDVLGAVLPWIPNLAVLAGLAATRRPWARATLFGFGFFLLTLLPVLGFEPMAYQRISWVADHLAYLPLIGLIGLATAGFGALYNRSSGLGRWTAGLGAAALCFVFAWQARAQAAVFSSSQSLWSDAVRASPDSAYARANWAGTLLSDGHFAQAAAEGKEAVRLNPDDPVARCNLGAALVRTGQIPAGIEEYRQALRLRPNFAQAEYNLAIALSATGQTQEADLHFRRAAALGLRR